MAMPPGSFSHVTLFSDSHSALLGLWRFGWGSSLISEISESVCALTALNDEFRIWWTPSHVGLLENELVDAAAKAASREWPPLVQLMSLCARPL